MNHILLFVVMSFVLSGCLLTRNEIKVSEERKHLQQQVGSLQQQKADDQAKIDELEERSRELVGRIEVLEKQSEDQKKELEIDRLANANILNEKLGAYEQALKSLEEQIIALNATVADLKKAKPKKKTAKPGVPKGNYSSGEYYFAKKMWDKAIESYEKYRKLNPKGRRYPLVTYKIGVSFQELGMTNEAKVFYSEVVSKFPKSKEAKKSKTRLSKIK